MATKTNRKPRTPRVLTELEKALEAKRAETRRTDRAMVSVARILGGLDPASARAIIASVSAVLPAEQPTT